LLWLPCALNQILKDGDDNFRDIKLTVLNYLPNKRSLKKTPPPPPPPKVDQVKFVKPVVAKTILKNRLKLLKLKIKTRC
jgi:protein TonB